MVEKESKVPFSTQVTSEVSELIKSLAKEEGKSISDLTDTVFRDRAAEPKNEKGETIETIEIPIPKSSDDFARALVLFIDASKPYASVDWMIKGLGVARSYLYRGTSEYQTASKLRTTPSVYEGDDYKIAGKLP